MFIKLLPSQIPLVWEAIKFAAVKAGVVPEEDKRDYFLDLLYSLMSDKAACFVRLSPSRELLMVQIVKLMFNKVTGERTLLLDGTYSFKPSSIDNWKSDLEVIKQFAISSKCKKLTGHISNNRLLEIAKSIGFRETSTNVEMEV